MKKISVEEFKKDIKNICSSIIKNDEAFLIEYKSKNIVAISLSRYNKLLDSTHLYKEISKIKSIKTTELDKNAPWE